MRPPRPPAIWRKARESIKPDGTLWGSLAKIGGGSSCTIKLRGITYHQDEFDNDPKNRFIYKDELQQFHDDDNLLLLFVNINELKEER